MGEAVGEEAQLEQSCCLLEEEMEPVGRQRSARRMGKEKVEAGGDDVEEVVAGDLPLLEEVVEVGLPVCLVLREEGEVGLRKEL